MVEETQEELMEKIKKMSPEELKEFQKTRCIFCHIINGKVQSKKIYEDSKVIAILDINPANPGHLLLIPKEHYSIMPQIPDKEIEHIFLVAKKLCNIILKALGVKGVNILVQNGIAAGQKAQHFMVHIIPRKENDSVNIFLEKKIISDEDYDTIKARLKKRINEIYGIKEQPIKENLQKEENKENNNDKNSNVVAKVGIKKEEGYFYYVNSDGDIARAKMMRGRQKQKNKSIKDEEQKK